MSSAAATLRRRVMSGGKWMGVGGGLAVFIAISCNRVLSSVGFISFGLSRWVGLRPCRGSGRDEKELLETVRLQAVVCAACHTVAAQCHMVAAGDGGICSRGAGRAGTVPPLVDLAGAFSFLGASCHSSARAAWQVHTSQQAKQILFRGGGP